MSSLIGYTTDPSPANRNFLSPGSMWIHCDVSIPSPAGGLIDRIDVFLTTDAGGGTNAVSTQAIKAAVYADSSGDPGALLGASDALLITKGDAAGWKQITVSSPVTVTAGTAQVHLAIQTAAPGDGSGNFITPSWWPSQPSGAGASRTGLTYPTFPNPASTVTNSTNMYAVRARFAGFAAEVGSAPVISPKSGRITTVVTVSPGSYTGTPAPTVTRQWQRDGANIGGQTGLTYTLQSADVGHAVTCLETATNTGATVTSSSNATYASPATSGNNEIAIIL